MRVIALVAIAGCGRVGFDPRDDATRRDDATINCPWSVFSIPTRLAGAIETPVDDWAPTPADDQTELYFQTFPAGNSRIVRATRATLGDNFGPPNVLTETVNASSSQATPTITADDRFLVYADDQGGTFKLYGAARSSTSAPFDPPVRLASVNTGQPFEDEDPWISADGLRLVFISKRSTTDFVIYEAARGDLASSFDLPTAHDELHVAGAEDHTPTLSADSLDVFFVSNRPGLGGLDVYTAHRPAIGAPFGAAQLVPELSSSLDEIGLRLTRDGSAMYMNYSTNVVGGTNADLYVATRTRLSCGVTASPLGP